jgi:uncharacterized protein YbjT (DUF2867 family)
LDQLTAVQSGTEEVALKIFVVGITGETGFRLARLLTARGDEVTGLFRRPEQAPRLESMGVAGVLGDLVHIEVAELAHKMRGNDVIVFTAGAGEADTDAMIDAIDGNGVIKTIAAARQTKIKRVILVSVFPEAGRNEGFGPSFEHYIEVKKRADIALSQTDLDWIILRPSTLINDPGVGTVNLGPAEIHTVIRRDDVAETLAELVHTPAIRRKILELTEGSTPIKRAVAWQLEN